MAKTALSTGPVIAAGELLLLEIHQTSGQGIQWTPSCTNKGSKLIFLTGYLFSQAHHWDCGSIRKGKRMKFKSENFDAKI